MGDSLLETNDEEAPEAEKNYRENAKQRASDSSMFTESESMSESLFDSSEKASLLQGKQRYPKRQNLLNKITTT